MPRTRRSCKISRHSCAAMSHYKLLLCTVPVEPGRQRGENAPQDAIRDTRRAAGLHRPLLLLRPTPSHAAPLSTMHAFPLLLAPTANLSTQPRTSPPCVSVCKPALQPWSARRRGQLQQRVASCCSAHPAARRRRHWPCCHVGLQPASAPFSQNEATPYTGPRMRRASCRSFGTAGVQRAGRGGAHVTL